MAERHLVLLLIGLLFHLLVATAAGVPCSDDDVPICAQSRHSGMHFLFGNECDLRKAQRGSLMDGPLYDVPLRFCLPNCDFECGSRYQPVCGISSRTGERKSFRNRCEIVRASCVSGTDWLLQHWGVCRRMNTEPRVSQKNPQAQRHPKVHSQSEAQSPPKPVPCTKVYRPVCAMYAGVKSTFSNECLVNAENIKTQRNWRIVSEGLCGEDSTKMKHSRKFKPKAKPKVDMERSKRSHVRTTQAEDFQIPEDAVEIYAPSTFHTEFISQTGAMVKSYSLPARKPYVAASPKPKSTRKSCVFGNEAICGSFKAESRTFSSVCELMEYSQKVGNAWTISYEGACRRCDKPCPTVYKPICATRNGIQNTIINECYLERARCKDPVSAWKFSHNGECSKQVGAATKPTTAYKSRISPLVPRVLYGMKNIKTTPAPQPRTKKSGIKSTTKAPSSYTSRQVAKRSFETTHPPSLEANNRKIRKIDMAEAGQKDFSGSSGYSVSDYVPASGEASWSTNDNWLVQKTLDNVKGIFSKKPSSFKKAHIVKYPQNHRSTTPRISTATREATTTTTTTTAAPLPSKVPEILTLDFSEPLNLHIENAANANENGDPELLFMLGTKEVITSTTPSTPSPSESSTKEAKAPKTLSLASTELLNLDIGNSANAYDDAEPELLFMLKEITNASSTTPVPSTTTSPKSTQPSTTELPTSWDASSPLEESTSEGSTTDLEETTDSPTSTSNDSNHSTTTTPTPYPTTEAEEMYSQTTGSESPTTLASDELQATTLNADYTADESFSESSGQTSIYGLDKNSLIMRLLRARSNKNVLI